MRVRELFFVIFLNKLQQYSKDTLLKIAKLIPDRRNDVILRHYNYLLEFANANMVKNNITKLIGLIHMCYGWMPTMYKKSDIFRYDDDNFVSKIRKNIKEGSINKEFLDDLVKITNNSIVGGSKLLHFCNPEMYAIYDSKVFDSIVGNKKSSGVNNIDYFISYTNKVREWKKDVHFINELRNVLAKKFSEIAKYSDLRCIEICFYYSSLAKTKKNLVNG